MTKKNIILDVWGKSSETVIAVQGEVDSRFLTINLIDSQGNIDLTGKTVKFQAKKPDGTVIFNNATITNATGGTVQVGLTSQMSAVTGMLKDCEIVIIDQDGDTLIASGINIYIMPSLGEAVEESISESTAYQEMAKSVTTHINNFSNPHNVTTSQISAIPTSQKNVANGVAALDSNGKLLTSVETDPTVPSWAKATTKPSYTFSEIGSTPTTFSGYGITDAASSADVGAVSNLTTTAKTVVTAINELGSEVSGINTTCSNIGTNIGSVSNLTTTSKTVVTAINELDSEVSGIYKTYTSVTALGLSYPCTTIQVIQAMPNGSRVIIDVEVQSNTLTDAPCSYGVMEIEKINSSRIKIIFSKSLSLGTNGVDYYLAEYNSSNNTIAWNQIFTNNSSCKVAISNGGTGATTLTSNAILTGNGTNAINTVSTNSGALYATSTGDAATFGTLPITQGGTGATTTSSAIANFKDALRDLIYPVSSIYMSVSSTNPSTWLGGTWVVWGTGKVPVGVDTSDTNFSTVEKTGGSEYLQAHTHNMNLTNTYLPTSGTYIAVCIDSTTVSTNKATNTTGTGNSGNLQPYITCYMWKRTA